MFRLVIRAIYGFMISRGDVRLPLVRSPRDEKNPSWSPDGKYIAYTVGMPGKGPQSIYMRSTGLEGEEKLLFKTEQYTWPDDWSPDGKFLLFTKADTDILPYAKQSDVFLLPLKENSAPIPFLTGPSIEAEPRFSPDGKWLRLYIDSFRRPITRSVCCSV